jgi:hypothetical protein
MYLQEIEGDGIKAVIEYEEWSVFDPREDDGILWNLALFSGSFCLPNESGLDSDDYPELEDLEQALRDKGAYYVVPVYGYSHGNLALSCEPFACQWDSGVAGLAYITPEQARIVFGDEPLPSEGQLMRELERELKDLQAWVNGEIFSISIMDSDDEVIDVYGGYLGLEAAEEAAECFLQDYAPVAA